jgi:hypothetical protein
MSHEQPINLEPVQVGPVTAHGLTIIPTEPLSASVLFDNAGALYLAEIKPLGVSVHGETLEMLTAAIEDDIAVLWSRYACARDEKLTKGAQALKGRAGAVFREAPNAV